MVKLELTDQHFQMICEAVVQLPFRVAAPLVEVLRQQAQAQQNPQPPTTKYPQPQAATNGVQRSVQRVAQRAARVPMPEVAAADGQQQKDKSA